jgi:hypothetical protein
MDRSAPMSVPRETNTLGILLVLTFKLNYVEGFSCFLAKIKRIVGA